MWLYWELKGLPGSHVRVVIEGNLGQLERGHLRSPPSEPPWSSALPAPSIHPCFPLPLCVQLHVWFALKHGRLRVIRHIWCLQAHVGIHSCGHGSSAESALVMAGRLRGAHGERAVIGSTAGSPRSYTSYIHTLLLEWVKQSGTSMQQTRRSSLGR